MCDNCMIQHQNVINDMWDNHNHLEDKVSLLAKTVFNQTERLNRMEEDLVQNTHDMKQLWENQVQFQKQNKMQQAIDKINKEFLQKQLDEIKYNQSVYAKAMVKQAEIQKRIFSGEPQVVESTGNGLNKRVKFLD